MSDTILVDGRGVRYSFDNIHTLGWLRGHSSGLGLAVTWLKDRAVVLFRDGKDEAATRLRQLADDMTRALRPGMDAQVKLHEIEFPVTTGAA